MDASNEVDEEEPDKLTSRAKRGRYINVLSAFNDEEDMNYLPSQPVL